MTARIFFPIVILAAFATFQFSRVQAQEPAPFPSGGLEQRVRDLEDTVRTLQGALLNAQTSRQSNPADPAGCSQGTASGGQPPSGRGQGGPDSSGERWPPGGNLVPGDTGDGFARLPSQAALANNEVRQTSLAGWGQGFFLRSPDGQYEMRLTGQLQIDFHGYPSTRDTTDVDTFIVRRARLGVEADVDKYYEFRLLPDFGENQVVITDAYANVHYYDEVQFEAGKFKEPFSYEQLIQDRFVPTVERSMIDQVTPERDVGVMIHGVGLFGGRLAYGIGLFNGEINGNQDTNDRKDVAARVVMRPFRDPDVEGKTPLGGLQVGFSWTAGIQQEAASPNPLHTPLLIPWFQFNSGVRSDGLRQRYSPEFAYFYGPFALATQYFYMQQKFNPSGTNGTDANAVVNVPYAVYYVLASYLLTGEERQDYSERLRPRRPFNPLSPFTSPGAWEVLARVSSLHVGRQVFAPGIGNLADPTKYANEATDLTLGINWYLTSYVRVQLNYEHDWFDGRVQLGAGPNNYLGQENAVVARLQLIY